MTVSKWKKVSQWGVISLRYKIAKMQFSGELLRTNLVNSERFYHQKTNGNPPKIDCETCFLPTGIHLDTRFLLYVLT